MEQAAPPDSPAARSGSCCCSARCSAVPGSRRGSISANAAAPCDGHLQARVQRSSFKCYLTDNTQCNGSKHESRRRCGLLLSSRMLVGMGDAQRHGVAEDGIQMAACARAVTTIVSLGQRVRRGLRDAHQAKYSAARRRVARCGASDAAYSSRYASACGDKMF